MDFSSGPNHNNEQARDGTIENDCTDQRRENHRDRGSREFASERTPYVPGISTISNTVRSRTGASTSWYDIRPRILERDTEESLPIVSGTVFILQSDIV